MTGGSVTPRPSAPPDIAVAISGGIDMTLDGGVRDHLRAGAVLVQRGTVPVWVAPSDRSGSHVVRTPGVMLPSARSLFGGG